ncbi:hypothetical protein SK128_004196, partial [Halocaridina rubra]
MCAALHCSKEAGGFQIVFYHQWYSRKRLKYNGGLSVSCGWETFSRAVMHLVDWSRFAISSSQNPRLTLQQSGRIGRGAYRQALHVYIHALNQSGPRYFPWPCLSCCATTHEEHKPCIT